jgi:hypothetical protein
LSEDPTVLVCMRVCDMATPPVKSQRGMYCALCGAEVWASMKAPRFDTLYCAPCARTEVADGDRVALAKETVDEVLAYLRRGDA